MREEYTTAALRGLATALLAAAVTFFTLWQDDPSTRVLISQTVLAGLVPLGALLAYGGFDARRNDRRGTRPNG